MKVVSLISTYILLSLVALSTAQYIRPPKRGRISIPSFGRDSSTPAAQQVHVTLAGPNRMKVSWMTMSFNSPSTVEYGVASGVYDSAATGVATSYTYFLYKSGEFHHVILGPLNDNTTYYYRCGGIGPEFSFKTPPPAGPHVPITFAVVGDLGQTEWTQSTIDHIQKMDHDVLLNAGDLSYADFYEPLWDSFGQLVQPIASKRPWMVTQGNHDVEEITFIIGPFISYNTRWPMPYNESSSTSNLYYSFEVAGVHVLMLGSYTGYSQSSPQYSWLQADLAKVNRTLTPWLVAVLHAPWYNSNTAHQGEGDAMMAAMEPLLRQAQVDIVFAGHIHAYERTTRLYLKNPDPCGIVYINIGDGGNREGLATEYINPQPVWSLFREASFGHGEFGVLNGTHAYWTWHRNEDTESVSSDTVWITSLSSSTLNCSVSSSSRIAAAAAASSKEPRDL
ncbi:hypothetical protein O6H91_06G099700 [Diphasiastrum complanatum]|uniref:Uncharacterized protein n=1 Tax=Diphasiastrum complanatum TaxID=34168 RepID=A0ACC2DH05_DIPCM|nr:hypothetical protein O6H91_06G099700 [Diphasiastrum complanatum]